MSEVNLNKQTKQFFTICNTDASNYSAIDASFSINRMDFNFNNTNLTNIQTSHGQKCVFTPINLTLDWDYINIAQTLKNNKLYVRTGNAGAYVYTTIKIPDDSYNALSFCIAVQTEFNHGTRGVPGANAVAGSMAWVCQYDAITNRIALMFSAQAQAVRIMTFPLITENGTDVQYDMTRVLGKQRWDPNIDQSVNAAVTNGILTAPVYGPNSIDLRSVDLLEIHSNVSKRSFEIRDKKLSQSDTLFSILVPNLSNGSVLLWQNDNSHIYSQEIYSNFDNLTIEIKDKNNISVPFKGYCKFYLTFLIERDIELPNPQERIKNLQNFNQLSSV